VLQGREIVERYRENAKQFTRERVLSFAIVVVLVLRGHKVALQNAVNKLLTALGQVGQVPTASAYCQARRKVKAEVYEYLNQLVVDDYYRLGGEAGQVRLWHGHRLLGYDGTILNLPDTPELEQAYTRQQNQYGSYIQAQAGVLYDLLNDLGVAAALQPIGSEVEALMKGVWDATRPRDVLVLDRHFPDFYLLAYAIQHGREIVVRCPRTGFREVMEFWDSPETDKLVVLTLPHHSHSYSLVRANDLPERITVRLIKLTLRTGETEVLMTTLTHADRYPAAELDQVYDWRWREETYFQRLKSIFEVERFSGRSPETIRQDFFGMLFLTTLESVLVRAPQDQLAARDDQQENSTVAKVNRAQSYVALIDRVADLLLDPRKNVKDVLQDLQHLFFINPSRHLPGRCSPRQVPKPSRKVRFYQYIKRVIA
jgi:hypothetical protein